MITRCSGRLAILGAFLTIAVSQPAHAQVQSSGPKIAAKRRTTPRAVVSNGPVVLLTTIASPVVIEATPARLSVISVPVPVEFPTGTRVVYTVTPILENSLMGQLTGGVAAGSADRAVLFAFRSPKNLPAGRVQVATVRFSTPSAAVEVPVIADVAVIRGITLALEVPMVATRAASPVTAGFRLVNTGNAPETVSVAPVLPKYWKVSNAPAPMVLPAFRGTDGTLTLTSPPNASGIATIRLVATVRGTVVAEKQLDVQFAGGVTAVALEGPTLRAGVAVAAGPWDGVSSLQSYEVSGSLSDGITVLGRATTSTTRAAANYAFSRAEMPSMPTFMQLSGTDWRVNGGTVGTSLSDLTGANLVGRGGTATVRHPLWSMSTIAATSSSGILDMSGNLAGSRLEFTPGDFAMSTSWAHLRETRGLSTRQLDAWSLGARHDGFLGGRLAGEFARRDLGTLAEPGWSASYDRRTRDDNLNVRYVRAPGGTGAFARATNEMALAAGRRIFERLSLQASAWRTADTGIGSVAAVTLEGMTLAAHPLVATGTIVSLIARQSAFDAATGIGTFGNAERALAASLDVRRGALTTAVTVHTAELRRNGSLSGDPDFSRAAPRQGVRAMIGAQSRRAAIMFTGQYERTGEGVGATPEQWSYGAELSGGPGLLFGDALRFNIAAERLGGSIEASGAYTMRGGLDLDLPLNATLRLGAERNPYIVPTPGSSSWIYIAGLTKSISLPRLARGGTQGRVYRDLNGNGRPDRGEPGLSGVALRRGTEIAVTDDRGSFYIAGKSNDPVEADARSLPIGWLLPSTTIPNALRQIGALSVAPLPVSLSLDSADVSRIDATELGKLVVSARDSTGWEWMSRRVSDSLVVFDALPPGTYTVYIDASALRQPLLPADGSRTVIISSGETPRPLRITMRTRQLRFSQPPRRSGS